MRPVHRQGHPALQFQVQNLPSFPLFARVPEEVPARLLVSSRLPIPCPEGRRFITGLAGSVLELSIQLFILPLQEVCRHRWYLSLGEISLGSPGTLSLPTGSDGRVGMGGQGTLLGPENSSHLSPGLSSVAGTTTFGEGSIASLSGDSPGAQTPGNGSFKADDNIRGPGDGIQPRLGTPGGQDHLRVSSWLVLNRSKWRNQSAGCPFRSRLTGTPQGSFRGLGVLRAQLPHGPSTDYNGPCWLAFVGKLESSREVWEAWFNLQSLVSLGREALF